MSNNIFKESPKNINHISQIPKDTSFVLAGIFSFVYVIMLFFVGVENSAKYGTPLLGLYLLSCVTILVMTYYIEKFNKTLKESPKNINHISQIPEDTSLILAGVFMFVYVIILFFVGIENSAKYGTALLGLYLLSCVTILAMKYYIEKFNKNL